jgi:glycosyltransferase involved in cell wall biosynthesis
MIILINAISVKKRGGGVFQIATNFILNIINKRSNDIKWFYVVSEDLHQVFKDFEFSNLSNYYVFPTQPDFKGSYFRVKKELKLLEKTINPNVVYSIASPSYFSFKAPEVMRFANAWITNPNKYAFSKLSIFQKVRLKLHTHNQKRLMRKAQFFITQSNSVKEGILTVVDTRPEHIEVIPNVIPAVYLEQKNNTNSNNRDKNGKTYISCVAVPSKHKNLDIIPKVLYTLREKYGINNVIFLTTIPENSKFLEQLNKDLAKMNLSDSLINYGYCTQLELIELYSKCDLCFFPTLLETFSATLLEAMFFNLAIVTTDLDFNKDVTKDSAVYFKPTDYEDAADKIAYILQNPDAANDLKSKIPKYFTNYSSFDNYIKNTVDFLLKVAENNQVNTK